jgi:arsenate reductase (thioredoxin)
VSKIYNVLFICTGNSARSQMAEALLNHASQTRFKAYSAGSRPSGQINPRALATLEHAGVPTAHLRCKSWAEFAEADAPQMDFIFTLCDSAAGETCPLWQGQPTLAHWGIASPGASEDEAVQNKAFFNTMLMLKRRIDVFTALPIDKLDKLALKLRLNEMGQEQ